MTRILHASTKLGRTTVWLGGLSVLLIALRWITGPKNLGGWAALATIVFAFCGVWLISRWALRHLMWRLRNRLIVTYIFIGVIPIVLLLMMAGVGSYLFAGQFATYIVISNLQSALQRLEAVNDALGAQLNALERSGKLNEQSPKSSPAVRMRVSCSGRSLCGEARRTSSSPPEAHSSMLAPLKPLMLSRRISAAS